MVGRAQSAVTTLVRTLVEAAAATGRIQVSDPETATFLILSLNAAFITTETIGNDAGVRRPDVAAVTSFCLRGLGAELDDGWYDAVSARLQLSASPSRPASARNVADRRPAPRRRAAKKP
jgi:hypothetical protein